jgi:hypothetical protein
LAEESVVPLTGKNEPYLAQPQVAGLARMRGGGDPLARSADTIDRMGEEIKITEKGFR